MAPAFGLVEAKGLLPYFMDAAVKVCELRLHFISESDSSPCRQMAGKWSDIVENGKSERSAVIDVNLWFGRATLDAYVLVSASGMRGPSELTSQKGRCWSFRVRLRRRR